MCGLAGIWTNNDRDLERNLGKMISRQSHRGPDAEGTFFDKKEGLGFGHRRLSILDLSPSSNQPFTSKTGRFVVVFNGEIYNYKEVQLDLGINPVTSSDTEILVEGFEKEGVKIFSRLNGMFSLAIWDKEEKQLTLARDRVGIKPLYILNSSTYGLAFASELKAFSDSDLSIDHNSLNNFLHLGYIPKSGSIYKEISKFPPGHFIQYKKPGHAQPKAFWDLPYQEQGISYPEALDQVQFLLESSVNYRLISDVPLGCFLSGGIDSSLVAAVASKLSSGKLKTFSIGFKESAFDESKYAKKVAEQLQTDHHTQIISIDEAFALMEEILPTFDEPFGDSSALPTMLVSAMARKKVTVALSGDGGDELFMGYGSYQWATRLGFFKPNIPERLIPDFTDPKLRKGAAMQAPHGSSLQSHIFSQEQGFFSQGELKKLQKLRIDGFDSYQKIKQRSSAWNQSYFDFQFYLPDDLLTKIDRASMKYGLECRVPLLDHRITEFAYSLPDHFKFKDGIRKRILKDYLYSMVPKNLFERPKRGFAIPLQEWLSQKSGNGLFDYLSSETLKKAGFVEERLVQKMVNNFRKGHTHLYHKLWLLIILHWWYLRFNETKYVY